MQITIEKKQIIKEIGTIPSIFLPNIYKYIQSLKVPKKKNKLNIALASESSLVKDWLNSEEEKAWQNL